MKRTTPYVKWIREATGSNAEHPAHAVDAPRASPEAEPALAAWLVWDRHDAADETPEVLAYLGPRPALTATLQEELSLLYPDLVFDWDAIRQALATPPGVTDVRTLSDDDLILHIRQLAHEHGLTTMDLALRLGYRQRQILPELLALLDDRQNVARYERTSGSIFDYMREHHTEYAFFIYKARLLFEGDEATLAATIAAEPSGFNDAAWQARRQYWQTHLVAYQSTRHGSGQR